MKVKFGEKLIQTKLSSRLSRKGCRLPFSPVLLRKFTNIEVRTRCFLNWDSFILDWDS